MFFYEGLSCPRCRRAFAESDDIVACPVCGAPHHRECWDETGSCACADDHGTDRQWSRDKQPPRGQTAATTVPCPTCGSENSPYAEICSHCGSSLTAQEWSSKDTAQAAYSAADAFDNAARGYSEYAPFHTHTACDDVDPDALIEGEAAHDMAVTVRVNASYYLPRFKKMSDTGSKVSWNWAAFLIPSYWLLHRKQYLAGALILLLEILFNVVYQAIYLLYFIPLFEAAFAGQTQVSYADLAHWILETPAVVSVLSVLSILMIMRLVTTLIMHIGIGMFGNYLYMRGCLKTIRTARGNYPEGYQAQLSMLGGTSPALALLGWLCADLLPSMILMLIV